MIEKPPVPSRAEQKKSKTKKKVRRKKDLSTSENTSTKLDELANELEMALSRTTDDEDGNPELSKSDNQSQPLQTNSTITITRTISFFSDDESPQKLPSVTKQQIPVNQQRSNLLHMDSITPMEIETLNQRTHYMSSLSEDDDENNRSVSSMSTQEYISPLTFNEPLSNEQVEVISHRIPDSRTKTDNRISKVSSSIPLNPNHRQIVLRLLNFLTQPPVPLEHLRLIHRRTPKKPIPKESVTVPTEKKIDDETRDPIVNEISQESNTILNDQVSRPMDERTISIEETPVEQRLESMKETPRIIEDNTFIGEMHEDLLTNAEGINVIFGEIQPQVNTEEDRHIEKLGAIAIGEQSQTTAEEDGEIQEENTTINEEYQQLSLNTEEIRHIEKMSATAIGEQLQTTVEEYVASEEYQQSQVTIGENDDTEVKNTSINEAHEELPISVEKDDHIEENQTKDIELPELHETMEQENNDTIESITTTSEAPCISTVETSSASKLKFDRKSQNSFSFYSLEPSVIVKEPFVISLSQESTVRLTF